MDTMTIPGRNPLRVGACLSLSGRFSRFGLQAARALQAWASLDGGAQLLIEDDASDVSRLRSVLPEVAAASDLLLGPYSTLLMRTAAEMAAEAGWIVWNHGGSGGDVETAHPGQVISVLTPRPGATRSRSWPVWPTTHRRRRNSASPTAPDGSAVT